MFVDSTLNLSVGLLSSIVTLASFVVILWGLSAGSAVACVSATSSRFPGYLVWAALIYAISERR